MKVMRYGLLICFYFFPRGSHNVYVYVYLNKEKMEDDDKALKMLFTLLDL